MIALIEKEQKIINAAHSESYHHELASIISQKMAEAKSWGINEKQIELAPSERDEVLHLISGKFDGEVLGIQLYYGDRVRVKTGEVKGALNGSGLTLYIMKINNSWKIITKSSWMS